MMIRPPRPNREHRAPRASKRYRREDEPRVVRLAPNMWPTLHELRDFVGIFCDPVTTIQTRTGFGYYGLGLYHQTPDGNDVPRTRHEAPVRHWATNEVIAAKVAEIVADRAIAPTVSPVIAIAFIRQPEYPGRIVLQRMSDFSITLYDDVAAMFEVYNAQGYRWYGRPASADATVLGVWGNSR